MKEQILLRLLESKHITLEEYKLLKEPSNESSFKIVSNSGVIYSNFGC